MAPLPGRDRAGDDHALRALGGRAPRRGRHRLLRRPLALVGGATSRRSGRRSGSSSTWCPRRGYERCPGLVARCRARAGSRARGSATPSTSSAGWGRRRSSPCATPPSCASSTRGPGAVLRAETARLASCAAGARRGAGRPRGRLPAQRPRDGRRVPGHGRPGRGLVVRRARVRRPERHRPLRADRAKVLLAVDGYRYGGKDFDRGEAVERIAAALPGDPAVVRLGYLDGTGWPAELGPPAHDERCASSACPSTTRCGSSTPRARPGCPRRSSSPTAASCSSSSSTTGCTSTRAPATACSGSPRQAG